MPHRLAGLDAECSSFSHPGGRVEVFPVRRDRDAGPAADHSRQPLYEAAKIDGAGPMARFFDVTLPQLRDVLVVIIMLRAIWDFKEFDLIFLLTGGGPVTSTQTLPLLVYKEAFALNQMGMASAYAVVHDGDHAGLHDFLYPPHAARRPTHEAARRILSFNLMAWALVLAVAFPLFWMVVTSLKPQFELFRRPPTMLARDRHLRTLLAAAVRDAVPHCISETR